MKTGVKVPDIKEGEDLESAVLDEAMGAALTSDDSGDDWVSKWIRGEEVTDEDIERDDDTKRA